MNYILTKYDEHQSLDVRNSFTLEEMEEIVEWVDQHPNYKLASIKNRFRKVKYMYYITRFREYIQTNGTRLEKLKKINEFMWDEFDAKRAIEKEAIHDSDLELFAIQKARELDWDDFKASNYFIKMFKKEHRISLRRYNKLIIVFLQLERFVVWKVCKIFSLDSICCSHCDTYIYIFF